MLELNSNYKFCTDSRLQTTIIKEQKKIIVYPNFELLFLNPNYNDIYIYNLSPKNYFWINTKVNHILALTLNYKFSVNNTGYSLTDITAWNTNTSLQVMYTLTSYFSDLKINLTVTLKTKLQILSIQFFFFSSIWAERELSELFGINLIFAKDTRRLLLDYSTQKKSFNLQNQTYNNFYFDYYQA